MSRGGQKYLSLSRSEEQLSVSLKVDAIFATQKKI